MKRWMLVLVFCFTAGLAESSEAGGAKRAIKSLLHGIKEAATSLTNVFVSTEATAQTSPTKISNSMTMVLDMNDRRQANSVSLEAAGDLVTVGIK